MSSGTSSDEGTLVFILENVDELTSNWHSNGGLVVVGARSVDHARLAAKAEGATVTEEEWSAAKTYGLATPTPLIVHVFPDAGCC